MSDDVIIEYLVVSDVIIEYVVVSEDVIIEYVVVSDDVTISYSRNNTLHDLPNILEMLNVIFCQK